MVLKVTKNIFSSLYKPIMLVIYKTYIISNPYLRKIPKNMPPLIPRDQLPYDAKDWNNVEIDFTYLPENTEKSCPMSRDEVTEYVRMESADTDKASEESLIFFRTAIVEKDFCWLWKYTESDGQLCYVTYWIRSNLRIEIGLSDNNGLSPEQYILAEYYDEVYW